MMMKVIMHIEDLIRDDGTEEVGDASKGLVAHHHAALLHHTALCHHVSSCVITIVDASVLWSFTRIVFEIVFVIWTIAASLMGHITRNHLHHNSPSNAGIRVATFLAHFIIIQSLQLLNTLDQIWIWMTYSYQLWQHQQFCAVKNITTIKQHNTNTVQTISPQSKPLLQWAH